MINEVPFVIIISVQPVLHSKASIYSVDLNFIEMNIEEMLSLLEKKIVWHRPKITQEVLA